MAKTVTPAFEAALAAEVHTLCTIWTVTRLDGTIFRFTDHDQDLVVGGQTFEARIGYSVGDAQTDAGFQVSNVDVEAIMSADSITESDLQSGVWDLATIRIETVDYENPDGGSMVMRYGTLGQVSLNRGAFKVELRGLAQNYQQGIVKLYSQLCRARFGDSKCGVSIGPLTVPATVDSVTDRRTFSIAWAGSPQAASESDRYRYGIVRFLTGANAGRGMEVKLDTWLSGASRELTLQLPMTYDIQVGDVLELSPGCDKTIATCSSRYGNADNFRGEPYVPMIDDIKKGAVK